MGRFADLIEQSGDEHIVAKTTVKLWVYELMREIGDTKDEALRELLRVWLD